MNELIIKNKVIQFYDDEIEKLENYVSCRNGKILWGMYDKNNYPYEYLYWTGRIGFCKTPFIDI
jgi:hypothetical protein